MVEGRAFEKRIRRAFGPPDAAAATGNDVFAFRAPFSRILIGINLLIDESYLRMKDSDDPQTWLEQHGDALFAFAWRRTGERELAEDMVQDTLLAAWKHRGSFRGESTLRTWLIAILRRRIIDERRRQARRPDLTVLPSADAWFNRRGRWAVKPQGWGGDPLDQCEHEDFQRVLEACIDGLPGDQAEAFKMRALRDLSTQECCNQLGVTTSNLGVRLYRARMALRRCLELGWFKPAARSS